VKTLRGIDGLNILMCESPHSLRWVSLWQNLTFNIIEASPGEYGREHDLGRLLLGLPPETSAAHEVNFAVDLTLTSLKSPVLFVGELSRHLFGCRAVFVHTLNG
jgi:hypothetical protein